MKPPYLVAACKLYNLGKYETLRRPTKKGDIFTFEGEVFIAEGFHDFVLEFEMEELKSKYNNLPQVFVRVKIKNKNALIPYLKTFSLINRTGSSLTI